MTSNEQSHPKQVFGHGNTLLLKFVVFSIALHAVLFLIHTEKDASSDQPVMVVNLTPEVATPAAAVPSQTKAVEEKPVPTEQQPTPAEPEPIATAEPEPADQPATKEPATETTETPAAPAQQATSPATASDASNAVMPALPAMPTNFRSLQDLADEIFPRYHQHDLYPALARRNKWEGVVVLGMTILPDGTITNIHVARSSGHAILDMNATIVMKAVKQISPLAPGQEAVTMAIGINYSLSEQPTPQAP